MRATGWSVLIGGLLCLLGGAAAVMWAAFTTSEAALAAGIAGVTFLVMSVSLIRLGRYILGLDTSAILRAGIPAAAQVLSNQTSRVIINNVYTVHNLRLRVSVPGRDPYEVDIRHARHGGSGTWMFIQPGRTVAVRVDPNDPKRVAIDDGPSAAVQPTTMDSLGQPEVFRVHAREVVSRGMSGYGRVLSVRAAGMTAGQLAPELSAREPDDQVLHVVFSYVGADGKHREKEALVAVSDGMEDVLAPGQAIPISYLPGSPEQVTIDWSQA